MGKHGTSGDYQRVTLVVTAALQGLAGSDIGSALAGASTPYLAQVIKKSTGDNKALNVMAHAVLGAVVAQAQGNSAAAGAAGAAGGELVARLITQQLYGTSDSNSLSEEQKQTVSALSTLAAGLSGGLVEGNSAGAVAGAGAGRNAVENNLLANKYGVERLDAASRALYEKLKAAGIGSIDELHERYKACGGNGNCEVGIRDEYRQQEKQAGEKLVELYQSGRLSKAEYDLLVTDYAIAMMRGVVDAQKSDADASFLDVYALSGSDWSPMGVVANRYVKAIRKSELFAEWIGQGLSEEAIIERARQDDLLGSTLSPVDVPGIISLVDKGASRDDVVKFAAVLILGKATSGAKASVDAPKGGGGPTYRPADSDQFEKILTSYYGADKTGSRVGNGGLADAVRYEKATGDMLSPAGYEQKAIEVRNRLSDLVRNADNQPPGKYPYSQRDIDFAKQLIKDIDNALGR